MSEGGGSEIFFWENQSWDFSNSDNSGGSEPKSNKNLPDSGTSNSQRPKEIEPVAELGKKSSGSKKNGKGSGEVNEDQKGGESDHEMHIWTERERRKKMRTMFANLHALLPQLPPKADKSTIVDEAVNYIQGLQHTLQKLQKQKLERLHGATTINYDPSIITSQKISIDSSREAFLADQTSSSNLAMITSINPSNPLSVLRFPAMFQTWTSPNVVLNVSGDDAQISVCSVKKPGLLSTICYVLEKHKLELVSAQISSDHNRSMFMIQIHRASGAGDQISEAFPVEEIFKQAAGEIMLWATA